jgi:hypothetical protein
MTRILFLSLVLLLIFSSQAAGEDRFCRILGTMKEPVCMPPLEVLIAKGDVFNGRLVRITGYFAYGDVSVLFSTRDAFMTSSVESGVVIRFPIDKKMANKLYQLNHHDITILGRYNSRPVDLSRYGAYQSGGSLSDVTQVDDASSPWGYEQPPPPNEGYRN